MSDISEIQRLQTQLAEVEAAIAAKQGEELKVLVDGFAKKLLSLGLSVEASVKLLKGYAPRRAGRQVRISNSGEFVLYASPKDPRHTWGGVGRRPAWVTEYLNSGGDLQKLKV